MSSSPRRDASHKAPVGSAPEAVTRHTSNQPAEGDISTSVRQAEVRKSPKQALKPRPSRWADEVDEDDQFIPTAAQRPSKAAPEVSEAPVTRTRQPIPLRRQVSKEESRYNRNTRDQVYSSKPKPSFDSRAKRDVPVPQRQRSPKQPPSKEQIEEIAHMKEMMAKKAEEKKRLKQEEEARIEAERRARCEAKLREIEEKNKPKVVSSGASTPAYTPVVDAELEAKRSAFNQRRYEVRQKREGKPVTGPSSPMSPGSPSAGAGSNSSPTRLSPHAVEFVPNVQHPPPPPAAYYHPIQQPPQHMHWMPTAPHPQYYGAPQMWHHPHGQWPPHGVAAPYAGHPYHPGHPGHPYPPSPAPQQYDPRDI